MHGAEALRIHKEVLAAKGPVFRLREATLDHLADCACRLIRGEGSTPGARLGHILRGVHGAL